MSSFQGEVVTAAPLDIDPYGASQQVVNQEGDLKLYVISSIVCYAPIYRSPYLTLAFFVGMLIA